MEHVFTSECDPLKNAGTLDAHINVRAGQTGECAVWLRPLGLIQVVEWQRMQEAVTADQQSLDGGSDTPQPPVRGDGVCVSSHGQGCGGKSFSEFSS